MMHDVKVSVCMITYNHERYIRQAVESIIAQHTNFDYEIVIGEDRSTDNTRAILQDLKHKHPDRIRLVLHDSNVGMGRNFASVYAQCNGQYIAMLEGDDYWTSPDKLQRQVDAMDANPDWAICCHAASMLDETGLVSAPELPIPDRLVTTIHNLLKVNYIQTCTVIYRGGLVPELPVWMLDLKLLDWPLHIMHARHGAIGFLPEIMAAYRVHAASSWSSKDLVYRAREITRMLSRLARYAGAEYADQIEAAQLNFVVELASHSEELRKAVEALSALKRTPTFRVGQAILYPAVTAAAWWRQISGRGQRSSQQVPVPARGVLKSSSKPSRAAN